MKPFFMCCTLLLLTISKPLMGQSIPPTNTAAIVPYTYSTGWTGHLSVDISNKDGWSGRTTANYDWKGCTAVDPPNGDTVWLSGSHKERAITTIYDLTIGNTYTISYYTVELVTIASARRERDIILTYDGVLRVSIGGTNYLHAFSGGNNCSWDLVTITFRATATTMPLEFSYNVDPNSNGNMWNIAVTGDSSICLAGSVAPIIN